jgi:hypothetical protein
LMNKERKKRKKQSWHRTGRSSSAIAATSRRLLYLET